MVFYFFFSDSFKENDMMLLFFQYQDGHDRDQQGHRVLEREPARSKAERDAVSILHRKEVHGDHQPIREGRRKREEE